MGDQRNLLTPAKPQIADLSVSEPVRHAAPAADETNALPSWLVRPKRPRLATALPLKTVAEAEVLIVNELRQQIPNYSGEGVIVSIYGFQPWHAMFTFAPNSATQVEAIHYRAILTEIVHSLRNQFEIDLDPDETV